MKTLKVVFMDGKEQTYTCERYWHQNDKGLLGIKVNGAWKWHPDKNIREFGEVKGSGETSSGMSKGHEEEAF